ncbi:unnamed protein product [Hydatigera taeniaeformis]|uniref:Ysc84 domain-containing protein n=1 Tax=Hydatigena taeniaeformis TaxID=6205 RepID=A0A0R3X3U9_HYDTA|nr:unnamed protein product [Hydatigera taeniaeformis]
MLGTVVVCSSSASFTFIGLPRNYKVEAEIDAVGIEQGRQLLGHDMQIEDDRFFAGRLSSMTSFQASEYNAIGEEQERCGTKAMEIQRHLKPIVSGSYGGDEVIAGELTGFSEPSSPRTMKPGMPPTPLNSVVITDADIANLIPVDASPQTIRRLLESAVAEATNVIEAEPKKPSSKTELTNN